MKVVVGSDHAGPELKEEIKTLLTELGHEYEDIGTNSHESCSYADYGYTAAKAVADGRFDCGIVICGTGIGISLTANKVKGIRCALCGDATSARLTREHNDANMLALGARIVGAELAKDIVKAFLSTDFSNVERHAKRVEQIMAVENGEQLSIK